MPQKTGVWRWNTNITWHYMTSAQYSATACRSAHEDILRYHHIRTCLYFGIGTLEAFANERMRSHLVEKGTDETHIHSRLRKGKIDAKIRDWPTEISGKNVPITAAILQIIDANKVIRDEITHPKRHDHSIYPELDDIDPDALVDAIAEYMACVLEALNKPFPYWLLGWNYVGFNGSEVAVFQGNNTNGFAYSFQNLGFSGFNPSVGSFEQRFMSTLEHYRRLKQALQQVTIDIEPYWSDFPHKPRLTRRWWDATFIRSQTPS